MAEDKTFRLKREVEFRLPTIPNYILVAGEEKGPNGEPQSLSIKTFTETELREIGRRWTEALVAKAGKLNTSGPIIRGPDGS